MFDPFIQRAFEKIKDSGLAPVYLEQISLLEKHVAFLSDKLDAKEREFAKAENRLETLKEELESLRSMVAASDGKAICIEIGPCFVKQDKTGRSLAGVYCPHCLSRMKKGEYADYGSEIMYICCQCFYRLPLEPVESALSVFSG
jgi:hypothetical protein